MCVVMTENSIYSSLACKRNDMTILLYHFLFSERNTLIAMKVPVTKRKDAFAVIAGAVKHVQHMVGFS